MRLDGAVRHERDGAIRIFVNRPRGRVRRHMGVSVQIVRPTLLGLQHPPFGLPGERQRFSRRAIEQRIQNVAGTFEVPPAETLHQVHRRRQQGVRTQGRERPPAHQLHLSSRNRQYGALDHLLDISLAILCKLGVGHLEVGRPYYSPADRLTELQVDLERRIVRPE